MAIFTILILPFMNMEVFPSSSVFFCFFHQCFAVFIAEIHHLLS